MTGDRIDKANGIPSLLNLSFRYILVNISYFQSLKGSCLRESYFNDDEANLADLYNLDRLEHCLPQLCQIFGKYHMKYNNPPYKLPLQQIWPDFAKLLHPAPETLENNQEQEIPQVDREQNSPSPTPSVSTSPYFLLFQTSEFYFPNILQLSEANFHQDRIIHLHLEACQIGDIGAIVLSPLIRNSTKLLTLNLGNGITKTSTYDNQITTIGVTALAKALSQNSTIEKLVLSDNPIDERGGENLAQALMLNSSLKKLYLNRTKIGTAAVDLLESFRASSNLLELQLQWSNVPMGVGREIASLSQDRLYKDQLLSANDFSTNLS